MQYVIGWNVNGVEMILLEGFSNSPRIFETKEDAEAVVTELIKDTGTCRIMPINQASDPPENNF